MRTIAFLDIETTGLDPLKHEIMEVGIIRRSSDPKVSDWPIHFSLPINTAAADEKALDINGYFARRNELLEIEEAPGQAKALLYDVLKGALVVGNNVQFDLRFIEQFLGDTPWFYCLLDLKAFVAGRCGMREPAKTTTIADVAGVPLSKDSHTALVDARWNRDVYDALVPRSLR